MSKNDRHLKTLKNLIGGDMFHHISVIFAGDRITFPKDPDYLEKDDRNSRIRKEYDSGVGVPDLMDRYELSQSQIYKIIEKAP